jgi:hypothetical protein
VALARRHEARVERGALLRGAGGTWVHTRLTLPTNVLLDSPHRVNLLWAGTG